MSLLKRMPPRRRREGLTDYRQRLKLVKSGLPRLVVRKTNRYIIVQVIKPKLGGDETILTVTSKKLREYGWKASLKNTPAAYLTGLLAGLMVKDKVEKAILDIGLQRPSKGARVFAAALGFRDAGVEIPLGEEKLPSEDRIKGKHITEYYRMLRRSENPTIQFSKMDETIYTNLEAHFEEVKNRILEELSGK
ncbi:MAG: 50S ribosomal protein L18 [Thaumarchaeota archaeon]|nr:MAG: 50S ribosomal protein L18 [Nitrososphaerota archaeon]